MATADLELPEVATPVPIAFPAANPPEPAAKTESPGETATKSPGEPAAKPPGDRPGIAIDGQLVLVVTDAEQPERKWTKLLDLRPLKPSRMLDPTVGYDARRGRITVDLKARRGEFFPKLSADESVKIVWETAGELPPGTEMDTTGQLAAADESALLYAQVDSRPDKVVEVRLSVDGYPRAFVYRVRCDRDRQAVPPETDLRRLTIVEPAPDQAYRIPLEKPLAVRFQVDAPADAFVTPGDVVEVGIDRDRDREFGRTEKPLRFAADRQIAMLLRRAGPDGTGERGGHGEAISRSSWIPAGWRTSRSTSWPGCRWRRASAPGRRFACCSTAHRPR